MLSFNVLLRFLITEFQKISIQKKLEDLRIEKGLSLQKLSEQTGISRASLRNNETDDYKDISHKAIITLADFYEVTSDYLWGITENNICSQ